MSRHVLKPLLRGNPPARAGPSGSRYGNDGMDWSKLDRVQVLGSGHADEGHTGCVNALSWSVDGDILLSGSDDKRVCIWTPDTSSASSSSSSPHPMKLSTAIQTGHGANIFSAKFLPNAGTPTVVTVAGDHEIRLLEIERLSASGGHRMDHWQHGGAGVRVLKCHRDRTKKIATENSPSLFMTVSEDGTVRQHDLRRPHRCRSECPDPLFRAPQGVDLYSLSVSTPAPHIFAVAGRTDTAFICDRRMLEKHNPSWGNKVVGSGQVHCVRRLGLPDNEWEKVQPGGRERMFTGERHITCVKMSPEHADEAIVSFQRHSVSLFSIYDDPGTSSARRSASPILPPNESGRPRPDPVDPTVTLSQKNPIRIRKPSLGKRKKSETAGTSGDSASVKQKTEAEGGGDETDEAEEGDPGPSNGRLGAENKDMRGVEASTTDPPNGTSSTALRNDPGVINDLEEDDLRDLMNEDGDDDTQSVISISTSVISEIFNTALGTPESEHPTADDRFDEIDRIPPGAFNNDMYDDYDIDEDEFEEHDEDGGDVDSEFYDDVHDDYEAFQDEFGDEDEDDDEDEDNFIDGDGGVDYDDDDEDDPMYPDRRSADTEFGGVELIYPRRMFRGAKNVETVKDCNFLGLRSDKVCSGSDDGHFFVWDKDTGRLEGIWEGDGSIVNVLEQHPTLPIVAVSGIDDTIKMFAPTLTSPKPSFVRTHLQDRIIKTNTDPNRIHMSSTLDPFGLLQLLGSRRNLPSSDDPEDDGGPVRPNCETQ